MLRLTMQAMLSGFMAVLLFTIGWIWYYVTVGWRWYLKKLNENQQREFFTWRYRMTATMIFTIVYVFAVRKFVHM